MDKYYISKGIGCGDVSLVKFDGEMYYEVNYLDKGAGKYYVTNIKFEESINERYPDCQYEEIDEEQYQQEYSIMAIRNSGNYNSMLIELLLKENTLDKDQLEELHSILKDKTIECEGTLNDFNKSDEYAKEKEEYLNKVNSFKNHKDIYYTQPSYNHSRYYIHLSNFIVEGEQVFADVFTFNIIDEDEGAFINYLYKQHENILRLLTKDGGYGFCNIFYYIENDATYISEEEFESELEISHEKLAYYEVKSEKSNIPFKGNINDIPKNDTIGIALYHDSF